MTTEATLLARPSGPAERGEAVVVERVREFAALASVAPEWNALVERSGASVYQTFEWCSAWWSALGNSRGRSLEVLLFRTGGELCAVAPFFLETETLLGLPVHRHLSLLGSGKAFHVSTGVFLDDGPSDYLDIIAAPEHASAVAERLVRYLRDGAGTIDAVELLNNPPGGFCSSTLAPALAAAGIECRTTDADLCPRLVLRTGIRDYLQTLDGSVRRRFQQAITAGEQQTLFRVLPCTTEADALDAFAELRAIHQRRWRKLGYPGLFGDARFTSFQTEVARSFFRQGWLRVSRADADGRCVAVRLSFAHHGRLYDYLSGFDDASPAAKRRPGLAILFAQMEEARREEITVIDFLRGDEGYKFEMTSEAPRSVNITAKLGRRSGPVQALGWAVARKSAFASFLLARERRLLFVQLQEHRFPLSLWRYIEFRAGRFIKKFVGAGARGKKGTE